MMTLLPSGLESAAVLLASAALYYAWAAKRWLWAEVTTLVASHDRLHRDLVEVHKSLVLLDVGQMRLPARMPSQNGEDVLLHNFFKGKRDGFFVDIGAYDGVSFSNTYFFEALGWSGVLVEAAPEKAEACRQSRPFSRVVQAAAGRSCGSVTLKIAQGANGVDALSFIGENPDHQSRIKKEGGQLEESIVPLLTLDEILKSNSRKVDFLSVDVEGSELDVLAGASLHRLQPDVIVVEDNTGGRDRRVPDLLATAGYVETLIWTHNVFYVRIGETRKLGLTSQ